MEAGLESYEHLLIWHSSSVVCQTADAFKLLIEFLYLLATWSIISKSGPLNSGLNFDGGTCWFARLVKYRLHQLRLIIHSFSELRWYGT